MLASAGFSSWLNAESTSLSCVTSLVSILIIQSDAVRTLSKRGEKVQVQVPSKNSA